MPADDQSRTDLSAQMRVRTNPSLDVIPRSSLPAFDHLRSSQHRRAVEKPPQVASCRSVPVRESCTNEDCRGVDNRITEFLASDVVDANLVSRLFGLSMNSLRNAQRSGMDWCRGAARHATEDTLKLYPPSKSATNRKDGLPHA